MSYVKKFITTHQFECTVFGIFFVSALIIVVLHLLFHPVRVLGMDTSIFYMDEKYTLASFFSTVTTMLIGFISLTNQNYAKNISNKFIQNAFGLFFIVLSFDEYFEVHEYTNTLIKTALTETGIAKSLSTMSWIFPLSLIILGIFILFYLKLTHATTENRILLLLGIACYFLVLVFELLGSVTYGNTIYIYFVAIEEGLEMIGTSFFLLVVLVENQTRKNIGVSTTS